MNPQLIGISGSPVKNSNTDRLIKHILDNSGLSTEFVKLSKINVRPCMACLGCAADNICKLNDDFPELAAKIRNAGAIVVGGFATYGAVNGLTKAFLERLFSLRHRVGLNRGKLAVAVATGKGRGTPGLEGASNQIAQTLKHEGMIVLDQLEVTGNPVCLSCGFGETCPMSALPGVFGDDIKVTPEKFCKVEDQPEIWDRAKSLGRKIGQRLGQQAQA